jgi:hypothetical protein
MKKADFIKCVQLFHQLTKVEIVARFHPLPHVVDFGEKYKLEDQIRTIMYGTDDLVEIGLKLKLLEPRKGKK